MTLRGLLAVKALLWWRAIPPKRRIPILMLVVLSVAMLSPVWLGAAALTMVGVRTLGGHALLVAFALAQLMWVVLVVISNAFSEAFDMRRMLRFPVHPRKVHAVGIVFALIEPPALFVLPELLATVVAATARGGWLAGVMAALAMVLLLAITGALLQLVLVVVLDLRRMRWLRLVHEAIATTLAGGGYVIYLLLRDQVKPLLDRLRPDAPGLVDRAAALLGPAMPTASWPSAIATSALDHRWGAALLALLGSLALFAVLLEAGWRIAQRAALGRETAPPARAPRRRDDGHGWRPLRALLPPPVALLAEREVALLMRGTQLFGYLVYAAFVVFMFRTLDRRMLEMMGPYIAIGLSIQVQSLTLSLFGAEREGLRLLFLLPFTGRALVLAKDLGVALQFGFTLAILVAALGVAGRPVVGPVGVELIAWGLCVVLASLVVGHHVSVHHPVRVDARGRVNSPYRVLSGLLQVLVIFGTLGVLALARWLAMRAAPAELKALAGAGAGVMLALAVMAWWWSRLDPAGRDVEQQRESMLAAIAVPAETG